MLIEQRAVKGKRAMTCKWGTLTKRGKKAPPERFNSVWSRHRYNC